MKRIMVLVPSIILIIVIFLVYNRCHEITVNKENGLINTNVIWSPEWKPITIGKDLDRTTHFSGSSIRFIVKGASSIEIQVSTKNTDSDTEIVADVNGKEYKMQNPNISKKDLTISFNRSQQNSNNSVYIRYFCTGMFSNCDLSIRKLQISGGSYMSVRNKKEKMIAVLGDSISLIDVSKNYSALFAQKIGYQLHNASIWGGTLQVLNGKGPAILRYKGDVVSYKPNLLLVALGINDIKKCGSSSAAFISDYTQLITNVRKLLPSTKIVILGILPEKDGETDQDTINKFNSLLMQLADNKNVHYINMQNVLTPNDYLDQYHPLPNGEEKLSDWIYVQIMQRNIL